MWIETPATGKLGKAQPVNVYFGEYTYGLIEKPGEDHFAAVEKFEVWAISPSGVKTEILTKISGSGYSGSFTPKEIGTYTIVLNNDEIDVIDYTKYDFGIFKTHYHSTAKVIVGGEITETVSTNLKGLDILDISKETPSGKNAVTLKILYKGEALSIKSVDLYVKDQWTKKVETNEEGIVTFSLPFYTKYMVEVTTKEEVSGIYKDETYKFIWHCATYCIDLSN